MAGTAVRHIHPRGKWAPLNLGELWDYRELVYLLTWRDLKARYKQTVVGAAWAIIQPLLTMVVFTVIFDRLANIDSEGIPYPLFSFAALVPWTFFANNLNNASISVVNHADVITKVYFPRLVLPLAPVLAGLVDFILAFLVLMVMMLAYDQPLMARMLLIPAFVLLAIITSLGVGLFLGTLNVLYRDVGHAVPFLTQIWLFLTPVAYPSSLLPEPWRTLAGLNPMAGVVEGFRWALLDSAPPPGPMLVVSVTVALFLFAGGVYFFRRMEETFADVV